MSLLKLATIPLATAAVDAVLRPPRSIPPPSIATGDVVYTHDDAPKEVIHGTVWLLRGMLWLLVTVQTLAAVHVEFPHLVPWTITDSAMQSLAWWHAPSFAQWTLPYDIIALVILAAGVALRLWSYATLGRLFTFQLAIRKDHALVRTGPYVWLRHPSYTAMILFGPATQWIIVRPVLHDVIIPKLLAPLVIFYIGGCAEYLPSILVGIAELDMEKLIVQAVWTMTAAVFIWALGVRIKTEEKMLKQEFKQDWTDFAKERYGLVPGFRWLLGF